MTLTYIKKIRHSMLCVTGVYLKDIANMILFSNFTLECKSSERLLFLFYKRNNCYGREVNFSGVMSRPFGGSFPG